MIDSVLKGTGNSRFLKSAVPAGTSWADALAMLQAGTFPIDFNGINTEGFQQVGTPLNKANLLKDATAAQIGLPPSTTPDGMFQALGNTGELHVWRKTVTTSQEIPAKYELGELQTGSFPFVGADYVTWESGTPIVADDGTVSLKTSASSNVNFNSNLNDLKGTYCKPNTASGIFSANQVIFIPSGANFIPAGNTKNVDKYQSVIGTPYIPAGTTTTYPVSTNPKAYQEGDDAKEAGYVLGSLKTGTFHMADLGYSDAMGYIYSDSITVTDNGAINFVSPSTFDTTVSDYSANEFKNMFAGKFVRMTRINSGYAGGAGWLWESTSTPSTVIYIPKDATFVRADRKMSVDRYQPVTGYAAIPAGTTIEYLGKLGDKARVQVVSYVGTGTNSSETPNSLVFDFAPKIVFILCWINTNSNFCQGMLSPLLDHGFCMISGYSGHGDSAYLTVKSSGNKITWTGKDPYYQLNESGAKYYAVAIG